MRFALVSIILLTVGPVIKHIVYYTIIILYELIIINNYYKLIFFYIKNDDLFGILMLKIPTTKTLWM